MGNLVDDLLDRTSQGFVLAAFRPQDFFSDGGDRHDVQVVVVDRLAQFFGHRLVDFIGVHNRRHDVLLAVNLTAEAIGFLVELPGIFVAAVLLKADALAEITALHQIEIEMLDNTITKADTLTDSLKDDLKKAQARLKQAKKDKKNTSKIEAEIATIKKEQADNKLNKKAAEKELKELYKQIEEETKPVIKKKFDYDIPIAKIDDAGITTTGAASEGNQLPQLLSEYSAYRTQNNLWTIINNEVTYAMNTDGKYYRCILSHQISF